jgi:hypothetical protein
MTNKKRVIVGGLSSSQLLQQNVSNTHANATTRTKHKIRTINTNYAPLRVTQGKHNIYMYSSRGKKFWNTTGTSYI